MATTEDPMELIPCPFNPVHMVQRKRMQYHILKCQKNVDMRKFRKCPFNAQHIVPLEEYESHVRSCEGRAVVEKEIMYHQNSRNPDVATGQGNLDVPESNFVIPETTECWDDDNYTVVIGPTSHPPQVPRSIRAEPKTRLPLRGENEGTKVFEYSLAPKDPKPIGFSWSPPAPRPLGRGRGKGRGLAAMQLPPRAPSPSEPETETATETETEGPMTAEKKRERDIRKLRKMLRQIEKIEVKQGSGIQLNDDQFNKLSKKPDVLAGLQLLTNSHP